jgi:uncharacterized protein (UPF0254 family)
MLAVAVAECSQHALLGQVVQALAVMVETVVTQLRLQRVQQTEAAVVVAAVNLA